MHGPRGTTPSKCVQRPQEFLQQELRHRFANELAATLASLHLVRARGCESGMVDDAITRVQAQARLLQLLGEPLPARCNLVERIGELANLLIRSRRSGPGTTIRVSATQIFMDGEEVARILVVMNELLVNALERVGEGPVRVKIRTTPDEHVHMSVANRSDGAAQFQTRGNGIRTMALYARMHGGRLTVENHRGSFCVTLSWPTNGTRRSV